jgi:ADP-ribose pyrophosphatase
VGGALRTGFLVKQPVRKKGVQKNLLARARRRFFVLTADSLEWRANDDFISTPPKGQMSLKHLVIKRVGEALVLNSTDGELVLTASRGDGAHVLDKWEGAIRRQLGPTIERLKQQLEEAEAATTSAREAEAVAADNIAALEATAAKMALLTTLPPPQQPQTLEHVKRDVDPPARARRISMRSIALESHTAARGQENLAYPQRLAVPDTRVSWDLPWVDYLPAAWTHPDVYANSRELETGNKWADPPDVPQSELEERVTFAGNGEAKPLGTCLPFDNTGKPLNPVGRTGLGGRGLLGKWGPNHAADPIVTRNHPATGQLQVVSIQRHDTEQWALPGGMVDDGEAVSTAVRREFEEEAGAISDPAQRQKFSTQVTKLFETGKQIYRGYIDDPRNTVTTPPCHSRPKP